MSKKLAVDWLYERLERMIPRTALYDIDKKQYYEQAKQIEEQQHRQTFNAGFITEQWDKIKEDKFEQYYQETFKSE